MNGLSALMGLVGALEDVDKEVMVVDFGGVDVVVDADEALLVGMTREGLWGFATDSRRRKEETSVTALSNIEGAIRLGAVFPLVCLLIDGDPPPCRLGTLFFDSDVDAVEETRGSG